MEIQKSYEELINEGIQTKNRAQMDIDIAKNSMLKHFEVIYRLKEKCKDENRNFGEACKELGWSKTKGYQYASIYDRFINSNNKGALEGYDTNILDQLLSIEEPRRLVFLEKNSNPTVSDIKKYKKSEKDSIYKKIIFSKPIIEYTKKMLVEEGKLYLNIFKAYSLEGGMKTLDKEFIKKSVYSLSQVKFMVKEGKNIYNRIKEYEFNRDFNEVKKCDSDEILEIPEELFKANFRTVIKIADLSERPE